MSAPDTGYPSTPSGPAGAGEGTCRKPPKTCPTPPGEASFFYRDHHFNLDAVKVLPGEHFVTGDNMVITTVLGSCVSACIWDAQQQVGGMNHFMLPAGGLEASGRYGSFAMELLINELIKRGARRETMQAKVFGGGQVMRNFNTLNVGERNTAFVLDYLKTERIAVLSRDVLDVYPRKLCYFPATGKAMVKRLPQPHPEVPETLDRLGRTEREARVVASTSGR